MRYGYIREGVATPKVNEKALFNTEKKRLVELGAQVIIEDSFLVSGRDRVNLNRFLYEDLKQGDVLYLIKLGALEDSLVRAIQVMKKVLEKGAEIYLDGVGFISKKNEDGAYSLLSKIEEAVSDMATAKSHEGKALAKIKGEYNEGRPRIPKSLMDYAIETMEKDGINKAIEVTGISRSSLMREKARRKNIQK